MSLAMNRSTNSLHSCPFFSEPFKTRTSLANNQKTVAMALGTRLLQGITMSTYSRGASVLQRAMVGMLTQEASMTAWLSLLGSATTNNLGSWNFLVIWLVRVPGIHREEALAVHPVYCPNLQTALCPCSLAQTTMTSERVGMEAMTLAASLILLQIQSTLKMQFPEAFLPSTNSFMLWLIFSAPRCTLAAKRRRMSVCS